MVGIIERAYFHPGKRDKMQRTNGFQVFETTNGGLSGKSGRHTEVERVVVVVFRGVAERMFHFLQPTGQHDWAIEQCHAIGIVSRGLFAE